MSERQELIDIVEKVKRKLINSQEIGLDPPPISSDALSYLTAGNNLSYSPSLSTVSYSSLKELEKLNRNCDLCKLSSKRKNIVFGEGSPDARLVFIGEAPGVEEDLTGKPFVGQAGKLLSNIVNAMGITRKDVYICNIIKCHPPNNRDPEPDEIEKCLPILKAQISMIEPEIICTLGRISLQTLINKDLKITRDRGQWKNFMGIPVMPTYHPAYLLRNPQAKKYTWEDMKEIMKRLGLKDPRRLGN